MTKEEPVAYISRTKQNQLVSKAQYDSMEEKNRAYFDIPLYTTPQQGCDECGANGGYALYCLPCAEKFVGTKEWVGLTDDEIFEIWKKSMFIDNGKHAVLNNQPFVHFAKAIEEKLKEKNTKEQE